MIIPAQSTSLAISTTIRIPARLSFIQWRKPLYMPLPTSFSLLTTNRTAQIITTKDTERKKMENKCDGRQRRNISPGDTVSIVLKKDQRTGKRTDGIVKDILTNSSYHPHGIKVRLADGQVGRVQECNKK